MSTPDDSSDRMDIDELVVTLNELLANLLIPIPIDTPLDLTPSLLLAILESILEDRLPISASIRKSRDTQSKVQAMKVFLGVLENDVLGEDVGLSDVDPRKLAEGEWDEVVFVGELLCWLGKKYEIIPVAAPNARASSSRQQEKQRDASIPRDQRASPVDVFVRTPSPTTHSTATMTRDSLISTLSMKSSTPQSDTSILSVLPESPSLSVLDLFDSVDPKTPPLIEEISRIRRGTITPPPRASAQCIHTFEAPSFLNIGHSTSIQMDPDVDDDEPPRSAASSFCHCPSDEETTPRIVKKATPVRYTGWIREADEELEIRSFEESRPKPRATQSLTPSLLARSTQSDPDQKHRFDLYAGIASTSTPRRPPHRSPSSHETPSTPIPNSTKHTSPHEHSLSLFNERAKLMAELADVRSVPRHTQRAFRR